MGWRAGIQAARQRLARRAGEWLPLLILALASMLLAAAAVQFDRARQLAAIVAQINTLLAQIAAKKAGAPTPSPPAQPPATAPSTGPDLVGLYGPPITGTAAGVTLLAVGVVLGREGPRRRLAQAYRWKWRACAGLLAGAAPLTVSHSDLLFPLVLALAVGTAALVGVLSAHAIEVAARRAAAGPDSP